MNKMPQLPVIRPSMRDRLALLPLPRLRRPLLHPPRHLRARALAPHVHRRNHPPPLDRQRETRQLEERRVLRVWDGDQLERGAGAFGGAQVRVRERLLLGERDDRRDRGRLRCTRGRAEPGCKERRRQR